MPGERWAVGVDVGGTKIAAGLVELTSGEVLSQHTLATQPEHGGKHVLETTLALVRQLFIEADARGLAVSGIGVGVAELVDLAGNVVSEHTIAWRDLPVLDEFSKLAPTSIDADVRTAALAEATFGAGKDFRLFVYVTVGTGISCCLVQEGRPFRGARGNALVMASSPLTTWCPRCGTKIAPVLEEIASGPALVARYNMRAPNGAERGEDVVEAALRDDPIAIEVIETAGEALGVGVAWLVNVLDPEAVVMGGGLGLAGGRYWSSLESSLREHIWAEASRDLPVLPAALGKDAGLIGAAIMAWRSQSTGERTL